MQPIDQSQTVSARASGYGRFPSSSFSVEGGPTHFDRRNNRRNQNFASVEKKIRMERNNLPVRYAKSARGQTCADRDAARARTGSCVGG